ncbi:hypothetical protein ES708_21257 [subsurface metagenome]
MKRTLILLFCFALFTSHELFLKSDSCFLNTNEESELSLFNGTFDQGENIITRDRIINAKIIELSAEEFNEYLHHEELIDVLANRKKNELTNLSVREKYSKHVKALFQVSGKRTNHFDIVLGYPIEFVPNNNPYVLSKGDKLSLRLLKEGKLLTNQMVHYSSRLNAGSHSAVEKSTRTDENGTLTIELDQVGRWYVATIYMVKAAEENIDYVSNWATLTFEVR